MIRRLAAACTLGAMAHMATTTVAHAQTVDLTTMMGGFTAPNPNNFLGAGVWQYAAGTGWTVNGRNRASAQLVSQQYSATGGSASFSFNHSFSFERNLFGVCFDGGLLLASINGGAFAPVVPTVSASSVGYRGPISTSNGSTRAGESAFCGFPNDQQSSVVNSNFSTSLAAGNTIQFAFEGVWDNSTVNSGANWRIASVTTSGLAPVSTVPEPSTYLLVGTGLSLMGVVARRRERRTVRA
jgi:hypothetical protein